MPGPSHSFRWRRYGSGALNVPFTCVFRFTDRDGIERVAKGRTFIIDGQEVDLFPIGVLCAMLGRDRKTIYKWEKDYGFPAAMWRVREDSNCNRWYSRAQLTAIRAAYEYFGRLAKSNRRQLSTFIAAVRKVFFTVDQPKGTTNGSTDTGGSAEGSKKEPGEAPLETSAVGCSDLPT